MFNFHIVMAGKTAYLWGDNGVQYTATFMDIYGNNLDRVHSSMHYVTDTKAVFPEAVWSIFS